MGLVAIARLLAAAPLASPLPATTPPAAGFSPARLDVLHRSLDRVVDAGSYAGYVVLIARDGKLVDWHAHGWQDALARTPMRKDSIVRIYSMSKIVTSVGILMLMEEGRLRLTDPVEKYLPALGNRMVCTGGTADAPQLEPARRPITIRDLLTHTAGYYYDAPWSADPVPLELMTRAKIWDAESADDFVARIAKLPLHQQPGTKFRYGIHTDLLGAIIEKISGERLDAFFQKRIFAPLGLHDTGFWVPAEKQDRLARIHQRNARGELEHAVFYVTRRDPTPAGGFCSGGGGLFSTAADYARFAQMLLNGGELDGARILSPASIAEMTRVQYDGSSRRGLGWDIDTSYSGPRGRWFPAGRTFGHTGWTGTSVWIDPAAKTFVLFFSNRVHPDGKGDATPIRREIATLAAEAMGRDRTAVLNGIDVLVREDFARLRGLRLGLITNQSGRDRLNRLTIDLLHGAKDVKLVALFAPEHGIRGVADDHVGDTIDEKTKLPVYSLYSNAPKRTPEMSAADYDMAVIRSRAPQPAQLRDVDALVFDIQDTGARVYTYSPTLGAALEAAAKAKKKIFVLDRVNPIAGVKFEGPVQSRPPSFIGFHDIPVRHGMTLGELALLFNRERKFGADLEVVRCENWTRETYFDDAGLPWINPSPSMRSLAAATLYTGFCLLESTNVSMGRGTLIPFEQVGAPYIDGAKLAAALNAAALPGVRFEAVTFTPSMAFYPGPEASLKYKDTACGGVRAVITDRTRLNAVDVGIELALAVRRLYPEKFDIDKMARLLGDDETLAALKAGDSLAAIKARWSVKLAAFEERRRAALLY